MISGLVKPDFTAPLDAEAVIGAVPADALVRGMFLQAVVDECAARGLRPPGPASYIGFKNYPLTDFMRLCVAAAGLIYPGVPLREGLRRLGSLAYPTLLDSLAGKAIFGLVGRDVRQIMRLAGKAYGVSLSRGRVELQGEEGNRVIMRFMDIHNFLDSYQVGVVEGAVSACGFTPQVLINAISSSEAVMEVRWS